MIDYKDVQLQNAYQFILVTFPPNYIVYNDEQFLNAYSPIVDIFYGVETF